MPNLSKRPRANERRNFLRASLLTGAVGSASSFGWLGQLPRVSAQEAGVSPDEVQFTADIEPLVKEIETTSRDQLIERMAKRVAGGRTSYRELLAALFLAGIRNVEPRPSVGFKFHAVLVVNSCHLASLNSADDERWLPIFWALDNFKSAQARDVREGNWTMAPVDESKVPDGKDAAREFTQAMDAWDVERADAAVVGIARSLPSHQILELFARYAARDFRSIGHKAIFVANAYRTLNCIGWRYAEPVLRSLAYALLNHVGEPNPSSSDLLPDRPWRKNTELLSRLGDTEVFGESNDDAVLKLLASIRNDSFEDASGLVIELMQSGVSSESIFDGLHLASGELLMRQPGIVGLHTLTTTNAMHFLANTALAPRTRQMLMMQNAAFLTMFRQEMHRRGNVGDQKIDELTGPDLAEVDKEELTPEFVFQQMQSDRSKAAGATIGLLGQQDGASRFMQEARRLVFLKGNDSHDYKFSSAVLEDYYSLSPKWRDRFLASSVFQLRSSGGSDEPLAARVQEALG